MMEAMRVPALALALSFGLLQPILFADCPCDFLCSHKNAFDGGKNAGADDCCSRSGGGSGVQGRESSEDRCFHVEPQTELDGHVPGMDCPPAFCLEILPDPVEPATSKLFETLLPTGHSPPSRSRLYLQYARLLI